MHFSSDNWAGVSERVADRLHEVASGQSPAYGNDPLTHRAHELISEVFEKDVSVYFVATGSAANAMALAHWSRPCGIVLCHGDSHVLVDECGGPELMGAGMRLFGLPGRRGKIGPDAVREGLANYPQGNLRHGIPFAISLTQATEHGTVYSAQDISEIAEVAKSRGCIVHMDGARFGNAVAALGSTPADVTWKAGVDALSFGLTKNGAWCAEAVVIFDGDAGRDFAYLRKQTGHMFSKSRFVAAQFVAMLEEGHWLNLAGHANAMARRLESRIAQSPNARLALNGDANEVFAIFSDETAERLRTAGAGFGPWTYSSTTLENLPEADEGVYRLVASFDTTEADVDGFLTVLAES